MALPLSVHSAGAVKGKSGIAGEFGRIFPLTIGIFKVSVKNIREEPMSMYGIDATEWMKKIHTDYKRRMSKKNPVTQREIADAIRLDYLYLNRIFGKLQRGEPIRMRKLAAEQVKNYADKL
jgi:hypothetical protein